MNVRRAEPTPSDIDLVAPLFDAYRRFYGLEPDLDLSRTFVAERLEQNESVLFVATEEQVAVPQVEPWTLDNSADTKRAQIGSEHALGFVQLFPSFSSLKARPLWVLNDLYVTPEGRGRGVGRALMDRARRHAEETRACRLTLETAPDNHVAKSLYISLGYVRDEGVEHYSLELK